MKILLVDDDAGSLRGMQLALMMLRHLCDAYSDPEAALRDYSPQVYDLVITDIHMPCLDGFALARSIRAINPAAKIIYISGLPQEGGAAGSPFLRKPIDFSRLKHMLDSAAGTKSYWETRSDAPSR